MGAGSDWCSQCVGDELGAEADADELFTRIDCRADIRFFVDQPGVSCVLVNVHRPAHDEQEIDRIERRKRRRLEDRVNREAVAPLLSPARNCPGAFKGNMFQTENVHKTSNMSGSLRLAIRSRSHVAIVICR